MSQKPKTTGSRRRRTPRNRTSSSAAQKQGDFGTKVTPPSNPPDITAQPWYPLTLSTIRAPGDYTIDSLVSDFQQQLNNDKFTFNSTSYNSDKGTPFRAQFRFMSVNVWNLTGRIVSLTVWEVPEQTYLLEDSKIEEKDQLGSWVDCGGAAAFPAVGYKYPASHHRRIFRPDPRYKDQRIVSTFAAPGDRVLIHLHILWKADGYPKFATVEQPHLPILRSLNKANSKLVEINESILEKQGSSGNAIYKGAEVVASYVLPVTAATGFGTSSVVAQVACQGGDQSSPGLVEALITRLERLESRISHLDSEQSSHISIEDIKHDEV